MNKDDIKKYLNLSPLTGEGGNFLSTYRSDETLRKEVLPGRGGDRSFGTAILYMVTKDTFSRMHRLTSDEVFHFYLGAAVEMLQLYPDGTGRVFRMGQDIASGELLQLAVRRGTWQGTRLVGEGEYAVLGTTMAPGFDPDDYEDGDKQTLIAEYPQFAELIEILAGEPRY